MRMECKTEGGGVPFAFFVELVDALAKVKPRPASKTQKNSDHWLDTPAYKIFNGWVRNLRKNHSPLPPHTTAIIFRFLFPEDNVQRKYGLQEAGLAQYLAKILGVSCQGHGRGQRLKNWKAEDAIGCLGDEVSKISSDTAHSQASSSAAVTIEHVDTLLTELAAKNAFSASSVHVTFASAGTPRRKREAILKTLYASLDPQEAAVVTQIILKDLRPLLYPIPSTATHYTPALLQYNSNAVSMLTREQAMRAWDPSRRLRQIYKVRSDMDEATRIFDSLRPGDKLPRPEAGIPVEIPKCTKGQGVAHALRVLHGTDAVWMETKYDGERAQIHVWITNDGHSHIKIISKSGRDSTFDRAAIHPLIRDAFGLSPPESPTDVTKCSFKRSLIVEAEMVAFSDAHDRVDEFWRIRELVESTAIGVRHKTPQCPSDQFQSDTQTSMMSDDASGDGARHLALVFFDVLLVDDVSLLSFPYLDRRAKLEGIVRTAPRYSMLAERVRIDPRRRDAEQIVTTAFAKLLANFEEGCVLKAEQSQYGDSNLPWVKLKKDYIPGYGDNVDLALIGASWEKERARELRVPPTAFTTFYFAALSRHQKPETSNRPRFEILFTSSYGLDRQQLEHLNFMIKSSDPLPNQPQIARKLPYDFDGYQDLPEPTVFLTEPLLGELFGAGFTKPRKSTNYELRFSRITKVYRPSERSWRDALLLREYQEIARAAVGRDRPDKEEDDWARSVFHPNQPPSPSVRSSQKRKQAEEMWIERLSEADGRKVPAKRARIAEPKRRVADSANAENLQEGARAEVARQVQPDASKDVESEESVPRSRTGLSPLGSVTNMASTVEVTMMSPPTSPIRPVQTSSRTHTRTLPGNRTTKTRPSPEPCTPPRPAIPRPPHESVRKVLKEHSALRLHATHLMLEEGKLDTGRVSSSLVPTPTLHQYLQDSVVWLARTSSSPRPPWRAPSHSVVPSANKMHTLDAFLIACGWGDSPACPWARRGVIFDEPEGESAFKERTLKELTTLRNTLLQKKKTKGCRPVIVLSMRMLAYDTLDASVTADELEAQAICRFVSLGSPRCAAFASWRLQASYKRADVFRFTLYWTFVLYIPAFILCGTYAFLNLSFPPRRPVYKGYKTRPGISHRGSSHRSGTDSESIPLRRYERQGLGAGDTRAQSQLRLPSRSPAKQNERRSRLTFAIIVFLVFAAFALGGAVVGSAIIGYVLAGLFKAAKFDMST
ncbi:uncharacterized protein BXZ73DRAFT_89463 [Epithele typhae]|uniref:uncharacterized protein n=1 Tax=Epithele typhae TaxID=378194 RepID=UPI002008D517|nr:uncharacterized protein BXZ73DRAFT_89463 [Epithele typhae]KAH9935976.1 hypothetical protein BXZ73DRAFT_89463 [Epithele typhae]